MTESTQRSLVVAFGIIVVLFLLLDGGTLAGALADKAGPMSAATWLWVAPTLLIFGLGFVVGWMVFGFGNATETSDNGEPPAVSDEPLPYLTRSDVPRPPRDFAPS